MCDYQQDVCSNCKQRNCLVEDFSSGTVVCCKCGLVVDDQLVCHAPTYRESHSDAAPTGNQLAFHRQAYVDSAASRVPQRTSLPYKRRTYFNERLAQWQQREPPITYWDRVAINAFWKTRPDFNRREIPSKEQIRNMLDALDVQARAKGESPRFIRKYLEKWLTIRYMLSKKKSAGLYAKRKLINNLRYHFSLVEQCFDRHVKSQVNRHSFMNYNFVLRRLLELEGYHPWITDFLPLKTQSKQRKLDKMWRVIVRELQWPYINRDREYFPFVDFF